MGHLVVRDEVSVHLLPASSQDRASNGKARPGLAASRTIGILLSGDSLQSGETRIRRGIFEVKIPVSGTQAAGGAVNYSPESRLSQPV